MISDVLFDALEDIKTYHRDACEADEELAIVMTFMDALKYARDLDWGVPDARIEQLRATIRDAAGVATRLRALKRQFYADAAHARAVHRFEHEPPAGGVC